MTCRSGLRPRRGVRLASALLACAAVAAGCSSAGDGGTSPAQHSGAPTTTVAPEPVSLSLSVPDGAKRVEPGNLITATAEHGEIVRASLIGKHGTKVKADLAEDGRSWTSTEPLGYGKTYTLTVRAKGEDGKSRTEKSTFTTATPARTVSVSINAWDGETVGVGMPLIFDFTAPVPDKAAAEDAIEITTEPNTEGAFHWFGDDRVIWRPKEYWQPGTKVSVDALIYGKRLGEGTFGRQDKAVDITVGDRLVAIADGTSHQMRVLVNGEQIRSMPLSMGKASSSTPNGIYTVMSEHNGYTMDSSTYGVPVGSAAGYRIFVEYAVRLSNSGIFYHSAPWSVGDQGERNVSHGCINLSTENAAWLMSKSKRGDLVRVERAGEQVLEPTDGWSVWQLSWEQWQAGSAQR